MTETRQVVLWECRNCGKRTLTVGFKPTICPSFGCQFNDHLVFFKIEDYELVIKE